MPQSKVLLIFIDGLGIGAEDDANPLWRAAPDAVAPLAYFRGGRRDAILDGLVVDTDPRLGVEGRPQSASGQTTILTGINAPRLLGAHKQGFPNQRLRDVIAEYSVFRQIGERELGPAVFANAYTPQFFESEPRWKSATTCAVEASEVRFRKLPDLLGSEAVFHDFTNASLVERGFDVPVIGPAAAARNLAGIASRHRFTLYEHFITDKIGHDQDFDRAARHLPALAEFVRTAVASVDLESTTVILTSDHGNVEDLSVRNHTLNDVPTVIWGRRRESVAATVKDLTDITPAIIGLLST